MKKTRSLAALFALLATVGAAQAVGIVQGATIIDVDVRTDGYFLVTYSQAAITPPSCVTVSNRMSGNLNTAGGKAMLSAAMLAYSTGSKVYGQGTGACGEYTGIESILMLSQRH